MWTNRTGAGSCCVCVGLGSLHFFSCLTASGECCLSKSVSNHDHLPLWMTQVERRCFFLSEANGPPIQYRMYVRVRVGGVPLLLSRLHVPSLTCN